MKKYISPFLFAVVALFATPLPTAHAAVQYNNSGSTGPGSTQISDVSGPLVIEYDSAEWYACYDDEGFAWYGYTLYNSSGSYQVAAYFGGPPPPPGFPPAGWNFFSYYSDLGAYGPPSFLSAFWFVAPQ